LPRAPQNLPPALVGTATGTLTGHEWRGGTTASANAPPENFNSLVFSNKK